MDVGGRLSALCLCFPFITRLVARKAEAGTRAPATRAYLCVSVSLCETCRPLFLSDEEAEGGLPSRAAVDESMASIVQLTDVEGEAERLWLDTPPARAAEGEASGAKGVEDEAEDATMLATAVATLDLP